MAHNEIYAIYQGYMIPHKVTPGLLAGTGTATAGNPEARQMQAPSITI